MNKRNNKNNKCFKKSSNKIYRIKSMNHITLKNKKSSYKSHKQIDLLLELSLIHQNEINY